MSSPSEEIYHKLIAPIEATMVRIVARIVRNPDDAADVMQETLAAVWRKLEKIDRLSDPQSYILRICVTRSYDALRRRARRNHERLDARADAIAARPTGMPAETETVTRIRNAIASLPKRQGKAVLLRLLDESPYEVIGKVLGCSEVTARSHCSKGLAKLRTILTERGGADGLRGES